MIDLKVLVETDKAVIYTTKENMAVLAFRSEDSTINDITAKWAADELAALESGINGVVIMSEREDFCVGTDIDRIKSYQEEENSEVLAEISRNYQSLTRLIQGYKKPVVTLIKGKTLDYGAELALSSPTVISINKLVFGYLCHGMLTQTAEEAIRSRLLPETVAIVDRNVLLSSGIQKVCQLSEEAEVLPESFDELEPEVEIEMEEKLDRIIEEKINPKLMEHQGWIELKEVTADMEVVIRFRGACSGCAANQNTVDETIRPILKEYLPEIKGVVISSDVSPELLDLARDLLRK